MDASDSHSGPAPSLRVARIADLPQILAIHNDVIESSNAIFSEQPDTLQGRSEWFEGRTRAGLPVLVAALGDEVLGFASYGPFRPWQGYRETVEHSVHVRSDRRREGLGRRLLESLVRHARESGMHVMVAGIDGENAASVVLHRSLGFQEVGTMPEVAIKHGHRLDLVLMQLMLSVEPG
jgi:L-amino acid N-acyltransferase YncA